MAGEANNLASHQGPEPNISNRKQQNFNAQMYIFPSEIKHRKVKHSKQTTVREMCTEVALLCNLAGTSSSGHIYQATEWLKYPC